MLEWFCCYFSFWVNPYALRYSLLSANQHTKLILVHCLSLCWSETKPCFSSLVVHSVFNSLEKKPRADRVRLNWFFPNFIPSAVVGYLSDKVMQSTVPGLSLFYCWDNQVGGVGRSSPFTPGVLGSIPTRCTVWIVFLVPTRLSGFSSD